MPEQKTARAAVILGVMAASTAAVFIRLSQAPPAAAAANRLLVTLLFLAPMALLRHGAEIRSLKAGERSLAVLSGIFLGLHFLLCFTSLKYTRVAASVVLVSMHPVFILIFTRLVDKTTIGAAKLLGTLAALGGTVLIALSDWQGGSGHALLGDLMALGGAAAFAAYFLVGRRLRKTMSNLAYVTHAYFAAWLLLALAAAVQKAPLFAYPPREWLIFAALAVFPTLLGHTVFNWALARVDVSFVSVMILGEPVGSTLLAWLFLSETPTALHLAGGAIVLAGLLLFNRNK